MADVFNASLMWVAFIVIIFIFAFYYIFTEKAINDNVSVSLIDMATVEAVPSNNQSLMDIYWKFIPLIFLFFTGIEYLVRVQRVS